MTRLRLTDLRDLEPTYPEVGATRGDILPAGYRRIERTVALGPGRATFERAGTDVLSWQVQRRAGLQVTAGAGQVVPGADVLLGLGAGPFRLLAPCRVIYVLNDSRTRGFAYGTLPGHPETGEESFVVHLDDDERVSFAIRAFSRPATLLARLGGPVSTATQELITRRYLAALQRR